MLFTLLHRAFKLISNFELFHQAIVKLKTILENNSYLKKALLISALKVLNKVFVKMEVKLKDSKKELTCVLP